MSTIDKILGFGPTLVEGDNDKIAIKAYWHALNIIQGRYPDDEPVIASVPRIAFMYARDVIQGRWPEGETSILTHAHEEPLWVVNYSFQVIEDRWPEAEEAISKSVYRDMYLDKFPDAKDDWALNGWIDWLDT